MSRRAIGTGIAVGALVGLAVGGVGGRLLMLALRLATPSAVGVTSDDGFEIGRVSLVSLQLLLVSAVAGAGNGLVYVLIRPLVAPRILAPLWVAATTAVGGGALVHEDGIDFRVLDPLALAVVGFVALPAIAAALLVRAVERRLPPAASSSRPGRPVAAARAGAPLVLVAVTLVAGVGLVTEAVAILGR